MRGAISSSISRLFLAYLGICSLAHAEDNEISKSETILLPTCDSPIYCHSQLLHDVQMSRMFADSKTFVDMKLKKSEHDVIEAYEKVRGEFGSIPDMEDLKKFVAEHFEQGDELQPWKPTDFTEEPSILNKVANPEFKSWIKSLNQITLDLSKKVKTDVRDNSNDYSLLYVPNGFVIPGGRFTELYYWDSYWILCGLLLLDMRTTARGVIENFFHLFRHHKIIPNGSRKYYLRRSQPPLLTPMVVQYYKATSDLDFVRQNIDVLEQEFNMWMANHGVRVTKDGVKYKLARFYAPSYGPRPESYREDYEVVEKLFDQNQKNQLYINLKSGAETGADFSSRWIIRNGTNKGNLSDIQTSNIIPVDLNAFLHQNALMLSHLYQLLGDTERATNFQLRADRHLRAIHAVLWNKDRGIWLDYDMKNKKPRDYFYLTNLTPLWTDSFLDPRENVSSSVIAYLKQTKADDFIGGLPTSLYDSGLQWDFPNGWPPLQGIAIQGLNRLGTAESRREARTLAEKWIRTNYKGFQRHQAMFEKYNVTTVGETGNGGEYVYQTGFGWTNGVVLQFLDMYPDLTPAPDSNSS